MGFEDPIGAGFLGIHPGAICLTCRHCVLDFGTDRYSELTPGDPAFIACELSLFPGQERHFVDLMRLSQQEFVKLIRTAENCDHYEAAKETT